MTPDFRFENHGSVCLLRPHTEAARDWLTVNIDPEAQYFADALVIQPVAEGYRVEFP